MLLFSNCVTFSYSRIRPAVRFTSRASAHLQPQLTSDRSGLGSFLLLPVDSAWAFELAQTNFEQLGRSNWFMSTNLNSDSFSNGTPTLLFDFPILAPAGPVTKPFDAVNSIGLFELVWDPRGSPKTGQSGSPQNRPVAGRQPGQFVLP